MSGDGKRECHSWAGTPSLNVPAASTMQPSPPALLPAAPVFCLRRARRAVISASVSARARSSASSSPCRTPSSSSSQRTLASTYARNASVYRQAGAEAKTGAETEAKTGAEAEVKMGAEAEAKTGADAEAGRKPWYRAWHGNMGATRSYMGVCAFVGKEKRHMSLLRLPPVGWPIHPDYLCCMFATPIQPHLCCLQLGRLHHEPLHLALLSSRLLRCA